MKPIAYPVRGGAILLVAAALLLGGCALQDDAGQAGVTGSNCEQDSECPSGQSCREGFCSARDIDDTTLNFRFIPPSSSDFLPQQIDRVRVNYDERLSFGLERSITVSSGGGSEDSEQSGGIRYAGSNAGRPNGTLIFRPKGAGDSVFMSETEVEHGDFVAQVTPGQYDLTFVPEDRTTRPKTSWQDQTFESNTILERTIPPHLTVGGKVMREIFVGQSGSVGEEKVANAQVYAVSADGEHTSTVSDTEAVSDVKEAGDFSVKVEQNTGWYDLHVVPASSDEMVPTSVFERYFKVADGACFDASDRELGTCRLQNTNLGAYPSEPVSISVQLSALDGDVEASTWSSTKVVLRGPLGNGTFRRRFDVNEDGRVAVELYPSTSALDELPSGYTLEVIPPVNSKLARTRFEFDGTLGVDEFDDFEVARKSRIDGRLTDSSGRAVGSARLEFRQLADDDRTTHDPRTVTATTDADGYFDVWLEKASYELMVVPAANSGQPRILEQISPTQIQNGGSLDLQLPQPAVLLGSVMGARDSAGNDLMGVGEVTVEVYRQVRGRTVVFGQSRTDDSGHFRMAVSAQP